MARRRYQRGSLIKEGDRWLARWREDVVLPSGQVKRVRRKEILGYLSELPTKKLAQRELDRRLEPVNRIDYRPTPLATFAEFAKRWQETVMIQHKPSTQRGEKSKIKVHLVPAFGALALRDIQPEMLQMWVSRQTCSPKMIRNIVGVLSEMWTTAKAWGYVHTNPLEGLKLPTVVKGKTYHFTVEESLAIIEKAEGRWKVFFRILAETGMRPGELAGLRIEDVGPRSLRVSQSVWGGKVQTPKSPNAVRTFAISASLRAAMREMVDERQRGSGDTDIYDSGSNGGGLLFPSEAGTPLSMDNFRHRVLDPILDELGIRAKVDALGLACGTYAFRHMNATLMDAINTPLKTRQKRLGHADVQTTLTHYSHAVDADDMAAADAIGALLSPKQEGARIQ